jgi:PAS domain S-box-containing protein
MPDTYTFAELVNFDIIKGLLDQFNELTGMPPSITDVDGNLLLTVGFKTICKDYHRVHPDTLKRCVESDVLLSRAMNARSGYACYECLNGLVDLAIPIVIDEIHMATLFIGQFFMDAPPPRDRFVKQAEEFGFDKDGYLDALDEIPVFPRKEVELAANFLSKLAQLIGEMGLSHKRLASFNRTLEQTVRERTDQLREESELRQRALAEIETIFNTASVAIVLVKGDRLIYKVNREFERLSGYTREEAVGQSSRRAFSSEEAFETFAASVYPRLANGENVEMEHQFLCRDGKALWVSMHGKSLNPPDIEDGVIWFITDITERKELERLKEDVERITRHDLKVPLNGIIGMCQSLLMDSDLTPEQREDIKLIEEAGFRMNNQIVQSLELYKIEAGTYEFTPVPVDLGHGVRKVIRDLSHRAAIKVVQFNILINGVLDDMVDPFMAGADPMLLHTLLSNLISNAVDAAPMHTPITINMESRGDMILVSIHNQGAVPWEIREAFFDKYVTHGKTGGTGLGTYTAKLMANAQNGRITMETDDSTGTTVTVWLPAAESM